MAEVSLRNVVKRFDDVEVVRNISLDIVEPLDNVTQRDFGHRFLAQPLVAPAVSPAM